MSPYNTLFLGCLAALCGCASTAELRAAATVAERSYSESSTGPDLHLPVMLFGALESTREIAAIGNTARLTRDTITSADFVDWLKNRDGLFAGPDSPSALARGEVARLYLGMDQSHQLPTRYELGKCLFFTAPCWGETADTGISSTEALTRLRSCTVSRASVEANEPDVIPMTACAVNTIAHEWAHTIPTTKGSAGQLFLDQGHSPAAEKDLVSYTVGALAQCVYLKRHGHEIDIDVCVHRIGTAAFDPSSCSGRGLKELLSR